MARFPYHKQNVAKLGRLLAQAALDKKLKRALMLEPENLLAGAGIPEVALALLQFKIVDGSAYKATITLPYKLNDRKITAKDPAYLETLDNMLKPASAPRSNLA